MFMRILTWWCGIGKSNPYALRQQILSLSWLPLHQSRIFNLKPTSCLIAISSIGPWMMLSIPIPLLCRTDWPVRPTWHYSAFGAHSRSFKNTIHAYLIYLTHVPYINDGCSSHSIYYCSCTPQLDVQLITSSVGFVAPSSLHSQLYHTWFYLSSIIFAISIPTATPAANEPRQANAITMNYLRPKICTIIFILLNN